MRTKEFFDQRAPDYERVSKWSSHHGLAALTEDFLDGCSGNVAADIGAGTGVLIQRVRDYRHRLALDVSINMLSRISDPGVFRVVADVHRLPLWPRSVDLVICRQLLHYTQLNLALHNLAEILTPGGHLHIVQVVEISGVPAEWDQAWATLRGVELRRHMRVAELETSLRRAALATTRREFLMLRETYEWQEFLTKHNVRPDQESVVQAFFAHAPARTARAIGLEYDGNTISYNRRFGFWLVRRVAENAEASIGRQSANLARARNR